MRLLTILCLVLLVSCSQEPPLLLIRDGITYDQNTNEPFTGIVEEFHENGQLEMRENFIDGVRDGLYEEFYEDGQLKGRGNFKDGKPDGHQESYHNNGQLQFRGNYIDGKRDGLFENLDENGNVSITETWENGLLIINGVEISERDGLISHQDTYDPVTGIVETFHENGQLEFRGTIIDGILDGLWETFDEDGNLTETKTYRNGEVVEENFNP